MLLKDKLSNLTREHSNKNNQNLWTTYTKKQFQLYDYICTLLNICSLNNKKKTPIGNNYKIMTSIDNKLYSMCSKYNFFQKTYFKCRLCSHDVNLISTFKSNPHLFGDQVSGGLKYREPITWSNHVYRVCIIFQWGPNVRLPKNHGVDEFHLFPWPQTMIILLDTVRVTYVKRHFRIATYASRVCVRRNIIYSTVQHRCCLLLLGTNGRILNRIFTWK